MYKREYEHPAASSKFLPHWRLEFQERWTAVHRYRSERFEISDADTARIKHAFQKDFTKSMRVASAELRFLVLSLQKGIHQKLGMFPYKISVLQQVPQNYYHRRLTIAQTILCELKKDS